MFHTAILSFLVLVGNTSSFPAGPSQAETISVAQPGGGSGDPTQVAAEIDQAIRDAKCPAVLSLLQIIAQSTRRDIVDAPRRIVRRGRTITPFGTVIETVPIGGATSTTNVINLDYDAQNRWPGKSFHASIIDDPVNRQRLIPRWRKLDGSTADLTIQAGIEDVLMNSNPFILRNSLMNRVQQLSEYARIEFDRAVPSDAYKTFTTWLTVPGEWFITIAVFNSIPGLSYTISQKAPPPLPSRQRYTMISWNRPAMGAAHILLTRMLAVFVLGQFSLRNIPTAALPSAQDTIYMQMLLQVLEDLLQTGIDAVATKSRPVLQSELVDAMALLASGTAGNANGGIPPKPFLDFHAFMVQLSQTQYCQPRDVPEASSSAGSKITP